MNVTHDTSKRTVILTMPADEAYDLADWLADHGGSGEEADAARIRYEADAALGRTGRRAAR